MQKSHSRSGEFRKVAENLYRYSSNGIYYARFRLPGKEIQKSLKTTSAIPGPRYALAAQVAT